MPKNKQSESNTGAVVGIIGLAVAAAAGTYFLYGTTGGKKKLKEIKGWAVKAKGEVLEKMENIKEVNEARYHEVIDGVMKKYQTLKHLDKAEVIAVAQELKGHWSNIRKEIEAGAAKVAKSTKKVVKIPAKNAPKKSAK